MESWFFNCGQVPVRGGPGITAGFYFDASLLGGTQWTITVKKTKTESKSFSLDISANPDGLLRRYQKDGKSLYSEKNVPGKVDTYRFFSFYLSPEEEHFDHFFSRVVDKQWLKLSDDPRAAALREAQSNPNPPWRILHRVTFVSRIPPEFQVFPLDTQAPDTSVPPNLVVNALLLRMVGARIGASDPSPAIIGQAVRDVLAKDLVNHSLVAGVPGLCRRRQLTRESAARGSDSGHDRLSHQLLRDQTFGFGPDGVTVAAVNLNSSRLNKTRYCRGYLVK